MKENKMGTMPMTKLIFSMSLPAMFSMLIQALYNIVDSIFVSFLGENALTAVSLVYPMQMLIISFAVGTGVGVGVGAAVGVGVGSGSAAVRGSSAIAAAAASTKITSVMAVTSFFISQSYSLFE